MCATTPSDSAGVESRTIAPHAATSGPPCRAPGERELLRAYLDFHRETLALKCAGLSDDDLRRRTTPSSLTLLGIVRHMAEVERSGSAG